MPNKDKNIPKRRFKEFENADAWELRRIFEIADRFDNLRIPIASSLRVPGSTPYYGANGIQDYVEGYTHDGEFVLVAEDGANDLKNYPVNLVNGKIWVNNHAHVLQGKENIANNNFLSYSINRANRANIEVLLVGGGRAKLNSDVLMDIELEIPSLPEQEAIGNFFSTLDRQITLHQRKLDKLKSVKQAYLSEMFPAEGERVPKRRFPGFTDAWELRKLGEIAEMYSGGTPSVGRKELYDGNIPFIRSAEINSHNTELFISELGLSNSSAKMVSEGTLLYALYGATSGEVGLSKISGAINQAILAIIPSIGYSSSFLLQWLKREKNNIIEKYLQGGQGNLSGAIVKDFFILFPSLPEQEVIGTFFSTLDRHITLHQRKSI